MEEKIKLTDIELTELKAKIDKVRQADQERQVYLMQAFLAHGLDISKAWNADTVTGEITAGTLPETKKAEEKTPEAPKPDSQPQG